MAVIVNGDGILTGVSSLTTALDDITSGRGTVTGVATVGTLQLGAGVSISSPRTQTAAIFTNNTEFLTIDDAGRVGVGTVTPNSDVHPQNVGKINVGFITARSVAGNIDGSTLVVAGLSTFTDDVTFDGATAGRDIVFDRSNNHLKFKNNAKISLGDGDNANLYYDGSNPIIYAGTETLRIVADNIDLEAGDFGDKFIRCTHDGGVSLYYDNSNKLETTNIGVTISGDLKLPDNEEVRLGDGNDLQLYHNGSQSYVANNTGNLNLSSGEAITLKTNTSEAAIICHKNAAVDLYHDNERVFQTTSDGIQVQGPEGSAASIQLYSDEGDDNADKWRIYNTGSNFLKWQTYASGAWQDAISAQSQNQVRLFYNGSEKINTSNHGVSITGKIYMNNGNLQFGNSSNGIDFSASSGGGSTSSLLDDYEEGTFSPTIHYDDNDSAGQTYNEQQGTYVKVGNFIHFVLRIDISNPGSGSGWVSIGGLPYTQKDMLSGITYEPTVNAEIHDSTIAVSNVRAMFHPSNNRIYLMLTNSNTSWFATANRFGKSTYIQSNTDIRIKGYYMTT